MKSVTLSSGHYAADWKTEGVVKPLAEINDLGARYAASKDPDLLLEICQCFSSVFDEVSGHDLAADDKR